MEKTKTQSLLAEDFFFDSKSRCNVVKGKVSQLGQREHVRDAERGLQDFPPPSTSRRAQKKRKKASIKVKVIAPGQNPLHVGAAVSCCAVRFTGKPDQPRFNVLSSNAVKIKS